MQSIKKALRWQWLRVGGAAIVCALIFTLGPHISVGGFAPLDSLRSQIAASMLIPVGYTVIYLIQSQLYKVQAYFEDLVQSRVSGALDAGGAEQKKGDPRPSDRSVGQASTLAERELEAIRHRFRETLTTLKGRRYAGGISRRWLYQRPWYVMIGPPNSGKTTAIVNSGLSFPMAARSGLRAAGGLAGTENCDWWITDDAVFVDTAGRYTVQEGDADRDKAVWRGLLRMLRRSRPRQPLNGVLVTIAISELNSTSEEVLADRARCIRERLLEVYRELRLQLPIYVLFTKSDLLAGFVEFFDDLGREGREAVWGFTFAQEASEDEGDPMAFAAAYDALVGRLNERLLERMQHESNLQRRALMFGFPQQVASLKHLTQQFLKEAFGGNSFQEPLMLRGVYFLSGTQIGMPFDRVANARSQTFEIAQPPCTALRGPGRNYFISRLLREVVFAEAGLVDANHRFDRRQRRIRYGAYTTIAAVIVTASVLWTFSYIRNVQLIESVRLMAGSYARGAEKLKLDRVESGDLRPILPLLQRLRDANGDSAGGRLSSSGLDQSKKIKVQTLAAYRRAVNTILLPRLMFRLETLLVERHDDDQFVYQALKVYLMLGQQGPLQRAVVKNWMAADWRVMFPAEADAGLRSALADHLDALMEGPLPHSELNGELIERSRAKLQTVSMARRVLDIIATSPEASRAPTWRLADHAGPLAQGVLARKSGQPLSEGVPGIYTRAGFYGTFLRLLPQVADAVAAEGWVLDSQVVAPIAAGDVSQKLRRSAADLYAQEFALRWDQLIGDMSIRPSGGIDDALRTLNTLSAPTSPMRLFLFAAAQELKLKQPPAPEDGLTKGDSVPQGEVLPSELEALFRSQPAADTPEAHVQLYMGDHFRWLHQLVEVPSNSQAGAQAPIDSALRDLGELYRSLSQAQGLAGSNILEHNGQAGVAIQQIEAGAADLPEPIRQWILGLSRHSSDLTVSGMRRGLASGWAGGPGDLCRRATEGRYPFASGSRRDIPLSDFARLFGRKAEIDTFFAENLSPFVDKSKGSWQFRPTSGVDFPIGRNTLAQFQRAATIRDTMFDDAGQVSVGFLLTVAETDPLTDQVVVDIDGQRLEHRRGTAAAAMHFHWPTAGGVGGASVAFIGFQGATLSKSGHWALFRLLNEADKQPLGGGDLIQVRLVSGRHWAVFNLQPDSVMSPLSRNLLSEFRCPDFL
ncbi:MULTISPECIES: type VI secretion system membrane subunit TssM [Rhizobium]|uniref:type VI secretion system membrane subunit TssM n=1 Tax=Rhizobium phaseoli TaxID=396 RepID=UPI000A1C08AF|nr:type VI secretion system membrane subunit TssM [Rhizobium phaseoli]ARM15055.1 type VI secretion system IcmF family protein [Rhizobium phaseoli Brasil 5]